MGRFIVLTLGLVVVAVFLNGIGADHPCPTGWLSFEHFCYKLFRQLKTWQEAETFCGQEQSGSHLVSIQSGAESTKVGMLFFSNPFVSNVWIGMSDKYENRTWEWSDGSNVTYTSWQILQPSNGDRKGYCVALYKWPGGEAWSCHRADLLPVEAKGQQGKQEGRETMGRFIFVSLNLLVLAFSLSGIGAGQQCPSGWFSHNVSCYKFFKKWTTWDEAQRICMEEQENGQLASIKDLEESVKLSDEITKIRTIFDVWIGLRLSKSKGNWEWSDGSNVTHTRWEEGEPNNQWNNAFCAVLTYQSRYLSWNDKDCRDWHDFVCKFQPQREASSC